MAVTWTIATLEHEISDGAVIISHWRAGEEQVAKQTLSKYDSTTGKLTAHTKTTA